jgi:septal ring factor EnvC (AmiA/AmiB activator)
MANKRGLGNLIREEAKKTAAPVQDSAPTVVEAEVAAKEESASTEADLAEKDKTIAKLEQSLAKAKTDLEAAQKEVLRLIDENKQLKAAKTGATSQAITPVKPTSSGETVTASGISIAYAHKRGKVLIPDLVVNQDADNNKDFAANAWML